jgi:hypothetical protein
MHGIPAEPFHNVKVDDVREMASIPKQILLGCDLPSSLPPTVLKSLKHFCATS